MKIRHILATKGTNVLTIHPDRALKEAAAILAKHNIGALVVVDHANKLVGILSERDIVRAAARSDNVLTQPVGEVMTKNVITALQNDELQSVMQTMTEKRFRHMPVLEQGQLLGIISMRDLVKAQLDEYQGTLDTLETQIIEGESK